VEKNLCLLIQLENSLKMLLTIQGAFFFFLQVSNDNIYRLDELKLWNQNILSSPN
jgi:hypothetical protein